MALSLESIYKPVNDFFFEKFKHEENAPVEFRLQQYATVIDQEDFMELNDPEEEFSDFVNTIPYIDENGINVKFLMNNIDETYELMLNALPFVPENFDENEKESIEEGFMNTRQKAKKAWEVAQKARRGIPDWFSFSDALPSNWYDDDAAIWEKREFKIKESETKTDKGHTQILKIRMTDDQLINILPMLQKPKPVSSVDLSKHVLKTRNIPIQILSKPSLKTIKPVMAPVTAKSVLAEKPRPVLQMNRTIPISFLKGVKNVHATHVAKIEKATDTKKTAMGLKFSKAFNGLKLNQKILVRDYVKEKSPSKPVGTNEISISFEYCVVNVRRPWFSEVLCNVNRAWYIPGMEKGTLNDIGIGGLSYLPIAFVAVKKLNITANWLNTDKKKLKEATSFGPFDINNHNISESGSLSHDGIQVIGWMLQKLPVLPPNEKV